MGRDGGMAWPAPPVVVGRCHQTRNLPAYRRPRVFSAHGVLGAVVLAAFPAIPRLRVGAARLVAAVVAASIRR